MQKSLLAFLTIAASAGTARAGDALPHELTAACGAQVKGAKKSEVVGHHPSEVDYQVWLPAGRALVAVTGGGADDPCGGGPRCAVFPVGRASARSTGRLGAGGASAKAFVMPAGACTEDACASILAVRAPDQEEKILDATRLPDGCTPILASIAFVPGQDTIDLTCSVPAGVGDIETRILYHVVDGHLQQLLTFEAGTTTVASPDEVKDGACTIGPVGAAQVVKGKGAPVLRITRAPDGGQLPAEGDGPACKHQQAIEQDYTWDAKQKQLAEAGPGRPVVRDTCKCKH